MHSRGHRWSRHALYLGIAFSSAAIGVSSRIAGPLLITAQLAILYLGPISSFRHRGVRTFGWVSGLLALLVPEALELLGLIPASYRFSEGGLMIIPHALVFEPAATHLIATGINIIGVVSTMLVVKHVFQRQRTAEERIHLYAWRLRQLMPRQASPERRSDGLAPVA